MKFTIQKLPKSQIEISFEVPAEEFRHFYDEAILHLSQHLKLEGFRSGHIPKEIVEKTLGQEKIMLEAANSAIKENYSKVVLENKIDAISPPEIEILKIASGNPFEFRAKVLILPEVKLPDYKKIASEIKKEEVKVEEKEVEESLKWLQKSRAKLTLKTEPCQKGDFVEINYSFTQIDPHTKRGQGTEGAKIDGVSPRYGVGVELGKDFQDGFILGEGHFLPGFEDNLVGMKINEEKEFSLEFPKDKKGTLAGKTANFRIKVTNIQKVELPETNDEWAKTLGKFENLEGLKKSLNEGIFKEKEMEVIQKKRGEILDKIAGASSLETPESLISAQQNQMMENLKDNVKSQFQISFEDYLKRIQKTEEEVKKSFLEEAGKMVRNSLILREIAKKENIQISEEEIKEKINEFLKRYPDVETTGKNIDLDKIRSYYEGVIRDENVFQLLEQL